MAIRYEVHVTKFAEQSMREISRYIAFELLAPKAAVDLLKMFREEILKLDQMPERVHLTPEEPWHSAGIRRFRVKNYYVYFWIDTENTRVHVTDVVYVCRDQERVLQEMQTDDNRNILDQILLGKEQADCGELTDEPKNMSELKRKYKKIH